MSPKRTSNPGPAQPARPARAAKPARPARPARVPPPKRVPKAPQPAALVVPVADEPKPTRKSWARGKQPLPRNEPRRNLDGSPMREVAADDFPVPASGFFVVDGVTQERNRVASWKLALLGGRLAGSRTNAAISRALAPRLGVDARTLSKSVTNWLRGKSAPEGVPALARALEVPVDWLLDDTRLEAPDPLPSYWAGASRTGPVTEDAEDEMETLLVLLKALDLDLPSLVGGLLAADPPTPPPAPTDAERKVLANLSLMGFSPAAIAAHLAATGRLKGR